jgi:hypothetical protein
MTDLLNSENQCDSEIGKVHESQDSVHDIDSK